MSDRRFTIRAALATACALLALPAGAETAPYAGLDTRDVATLPADRIEGLRAGAGLGYALSAELNGLPGPLHVLELADTLELTPEQHTAVEKVRQDMLDRAVPLGAQLIAAETALDRAFEAGTDAAEVARLTAAAAAVEAELRAAHLVAHLETAPLLDRHQTMLYARARGYGAAEGHAGHGGH